MAAKSQYQIHQVSALSGSGSLWGCITSLWRTLHSLLVKGCQHDYKMAAIFTSLFLPTESRLEAWRWKTQSFAGPNGMWTISHLYLRAQLQVWYISRMYTTSSVAKRALTFGFAVKTTQHFTQVSDVFKLFFLSSFFLSWKKWSHVLFKWSNQAGRGLDSSFCVSSCFSNRYRQNGLPNRAACGCEELNPFTAMVAAPSLENDH